MGHWALDDIPWDLFDRNKVDPEMVRIVKAASLVEYNGVAYAHHLCRIFNDDTEFQQKARSWGEEEIQHGKALARWAAMADPEFDFEAAFARFQAGYRVDFDLDVSRRGSRSGEMIARCMVEVGTSSYYSALRDAVQNTSNYQGVIGTLTCTPLGDCATSVTIGVYKVPDVGFEDPSAKPVFTETKTLADVQ